MPDIAFHFNMPEKLPYALRLLRKASSAGARVVVTGEPGHLAKVSAKLWSLAPHEFLAHCSGRGSESELRYSPIVLSSSPQMAPHREVLVNLGPAVPSGFDEFARVIELVSRDDHDRQVGRQRWRHYSDLGYSITRHDIIVQERTP